jgi:hypothetical protein
MATQKHMGKHSLIDRLASQVGSRDLAIGILQKRGQSDAFGNLTSAGKKRDAMTAKERALDRASKASGHPTSKYVYDPRTNRAKLKG